MMQVGIFTGYFPGVLEDSARVIRSHGFNTVQLDLSFKDLDLSTDHLTTKKCHLIRDTFRRHNLPICCLSGYTNLVQPDADKRTEELRRLKRIIELANECGTPYVISETGTFHPDSDWMHHPKNKTTEGYDTCVETIIALVDHAVKYGVTFLVEPYVNNVIGSIDETERLFADVGRKNLGLLMDPANYFEAHNLDQMDSVLHDLFDRLSDKILIAHAKDVKRSTSTQSVQMVAVEVTEGHALRGVGAIDLPAAGLGSLNYEVYLRRLGQRHPNLPIILEHLDAGDVPRAKSFVDQKLLEFGV
jgi:sugar phosphate isomerase/epimerase